MSGEGVADSFPIWILGYCDDIIVRPGQELTFRVSGQGAETFRADLVRLRHGDTTPGGPGFRETELDSEVNGVYPLLDQPAHVGSYGRLPGARDILRSPDGSLTLFAFVQPTTDGARQPVLSAWDAATSTGVALVLTEGLRPAVVFGAGRDSRCLTAPAGLRAATWYALAASWDGATGLAAVTAVPVVNRYNSRFGRLVANDVVQVSGALGGPPEIPAVDLLLGALDTTDGAVVRGAYNGKIALPAVYRRALTGGEVRRLATSGNAPTVTDGLTAWWDLSARIDSTEIRPGGGTDGGTRATGRLVNMPTRAVTAQNWDGSSYDWTAHPELYGAVHLHCDDVDDTGWAATCTLPVGADLPSGVYALRLRADGFEDHVPFLVGPAPGHEKSIALLLPTASYQAYANEHLSSGSPLGQAVGGHTPLVQPLDVFQLEHGVFGRSTYDLHADGSGVAYTSRRRPILNMRPRYRFTHMGTWQFPADLYLVNWLTEKGYDFDVICDEDVHRRGVAAMRPYRVVMTGTHPEYTSEPMLDAYEDYIGGGGRVMYMGGNGFYWVVSFHPEKPWVMEVRKGEAGSRAWQAAPGETLHSTTGEKGGLWRNRGRAPQKVFGAGFTAEGFTGSSYYRRMPDSADAKVSWVFSGVGEEELIGDFGLERGGAAGQELDRADVRLGTPPGTYLLASSEYHDDSYLLVVEEIGFMYPGLGGSEHRDVRADMTLFETESGGAVFSTSSIAWAGSLSHNDCDNNVSRITANVLDRFLKQGSGHPVDRHRPGGRPLA
ncbi:LamG domain-containing protein [Frankia gtarii]|uniref:LamG domain-containing protein n=1 Tax=Frankia gtarii TaxID=2950102 RepID=UPI0021BE22B2|nr:LamG domain-containing protein [Frankia gtarii]